MKRPFISVRFESLLLSALVVVLSLAAANARAGTSMSMNIIQFGSTADNTATYGIFLGLTTTDVPITYYEVYSPNTNSYAGTGTGSSFNVFSLPDFHAVLNELTNTWKLVVNQGDASQKIYTFTISLNGFTSNSLPNLQIFNPPNNAVDVPLHPTFTFTGPAGWQSLSVFLNQGNNYFDNLGLPVNTTNWTSSKTMAPGLDYNFTIEYGTDATALFNFNTPVTTNSQALPGWSGSASLTMQDTSLFTTAADTLGLQSALDAANLAWTTSGDALWFGETNVSQDGVSAAQSGALTDSQTSVLQTTVTGPGQLSFYWQTLGQPDNFDLEFDVDGSPVTDIGSQTPWQQFSYSISSGPHTLTWTALANSGPSPDDAGYVDEVSYVTNAVAPPPRLGTWARTGSMTTDRGQFTLTVLGNGQVLAAGGLINGFPEASTSSADLFNPATGTWTNTGYMITDRRFHTATTLPGGNVLVAGGISGLLNGPKITNAEIYLSASGVWTNTGSLLTAHAGHAAALLTNGLVLVAGGITNQTCELYNPATQTWTNTGPLNEMRISAAAFTLPNGKVLIEGGASDNTAELYDPATKMWTYANSLLMEQDSSVAVLLPNGTVLVAGGTDVNGNYSGFAEIYDPLAGTWSETGSMNTPRNQASAVVLANGIVLVAGGQGAAGTLTDAELYDPAHGTWTETGAMLDSRDEFIMAPLANSRALATGGFAATAEIYGTSLPVIILTNPAKVTNGFQFSFTNTPGASNWVYATTNLAVPFTNWSNLGSATEVTAGHFQFTDTQATNNLRRFYRVGTP
jgi:hypothetical protein